MTGFELAKTYDTAAEKLIVCAMDAAKKVYADMGADFDALPESERMEIVYGLIKRCMVKSDRSIERRDSEKRAKLYREWHLANLADDENYYQAARYVRIAPNASDDDELDDDAVMAHLASGELDDQLDGLLGMFQFCHGMFWRYGWTVNGKHYRDPDQALDAAGIHIPRRITLLPRR